MPSQSVPAMLVRGRSVVVIGAGPELNRDSYTSLVEGADTVVRVNPRSCREGMLLSLVQQRHTTGRIDIAYHAGAARGERVVGARGELVELHPATSLEPQTLASLVLSGCKAVIVPPHRVDAARVRCSTTQSVCPVLPYHGPYPDGHSCPTTGLGAIRDLLRLRPRVLYIIGFDCYQSGRPYVSGHVEQSMMGGSDVRDYAPPPGATGVGPHDFAKELVTLHRICTSNTDVVCVTTHLKGVFRKAGYDASSLRVVPPDSK